ncbi:MAG: hypothetical protein AB1491_09310 [Thermodesulfobacteriota bacterium]
MRRLLEGELELAVVSGFLYLPLRFDPGVAREVHREPGETAGGEARVGVIQVAGQHFVKTLSLASLIKNYGKVHPDAYEQLRDDYRRKHGLAAGWPGMLVGRKLQTIIFQIMPHFLRRKAGPGRKRLSPEEILELIGENHRIPPEYQEKARTYLDLEFLRNRLRELEESDEPVEPLKEGLVTSRQLRVWLHQTLAGEFRQEEKERLQEALKERGALAATRSRHLAVMLYLAEVGSLEMEGFGFFRLGWVDDYCIYKRTGKFALKDFYGRPYLFPDCRVAVYTTGSLKPVVLEKYKHPFLSRYAPGQEICLSNFRPSREFTAKNVIRALTEGLNGLFYNYTSRYRKGYHRLDKFWEAGQTFNFDDYRVPRDHPSLVSGEIEIKNDFT